MTKVRKIQNFGSAIRFAAISFVLFVPVMACADLLTRTNAVDDFQAVGAPKTVTNITNMPGNNFSEANTPLAAELASINQPHLIARQSRVQFFRQMFAVPLQLQRGSPSIEEQGIGADSPIRGADRFSLSPQISVQQAAIESLQNRVAARHPPNPLMPLGGLATAFHLISNGVAKIMIRNLDAGHLPVYGENGAVIGTRDALTGNLTAGREMPKRKGQFLTNQG